MSDKLHRLNCWEFKNCGREPGGLMAETAGVCPIAAAMLLDGVNGGVAAGRTCWTVSEHLGRLAPGAPAGQCHQCDFYRRVLFEEEDRALYTFFAHET